MGRHEIRTLVVTFVLGIATQTAVARDITVSAAVSLKEALTEVVKAYAKQTEARVNLNFGATGHLLAQMRDGAPVDGFVSAAEVHMDQAVTDGLVKGDTRAVIAANRLVLIVPADAKGAVDSFESLGRPEFRRLAIGQPRIVPAGHYAEQAMKRLGVLESVRDRLIFGGSVRQVLDYVERGEVDAGVVYATDAKQAGDKVRVVAIADPSWHEPILYSVATVAASRNEADMAAFSAFLRSDAARALLAARGFVPPPAPPAPQRAATTPAAASPRR